MNDVVLYLSPLLLAMIAWGGLALWFDGPRPRVLPIAFVAGSSAVLWAAPALFPVLFLAVLVWWLRLKPSNDRDWQPDVAHLPHVSIAGDTVTISNVRNFDYEDQMERWEERDFDLQELEGVDLFLCYWGPRRIAHTITSFVFRGDRYLPISIETRKEKGESYSPIRAFFRQFELYYVVSDERDVIGVRTSVRGEQVLLYRLTLTADASRALLREYLADISRLSDEPRWYNAVSANCTTSIHRLTRRTVSGSRWDWRMLINGYVDELAYERGRLDTSLPFADLRARSDIAERARGAGDDFSSRIREGLPTPRGSRA